tara:strand:- start:103 stop:582 length:480 start_codon:yes stop_codon:yes gene_type:complete
MNYLKTLLGVVVLLSASRFIPHPPNFTSLLALSFYIPAVFGIKFIPIVVLSLAFTDLIIGFHSTILFTWGSVIIIGLISNYFNKSILFRISGCLIGAFLFYLITNFGVWTNGFYGYSLEGLISCYILALPFFGYSLLSALIFSTIIETVYKFYKKLKLN